MQVIHGCLLLLSLIISCVCAPQVAPPMAGAPMAGSPAGLPEELMMSQEEFNQMLEFLSTLDEKELQELEQIGRQVLLESGINPDTLEPINPTEQAQVPVSPVSREPGIQVPTKPALPAETQEEIRTLLRKLIDSLSSLRHKASIYKEEKNLQRWQHELDDLIYYLKIISKKEQFARLQDKEYQPLLKHIRTLADTLVVYEPLFVLPDVAQNHEDPYEVLGIAEDATTEDIEKLFAELSQAKSPVSVRRISEEGGLAGKDLERAVKEARLSFGVIEDAYEKLIDPKIRSQVDRERATLRAHKLETMKGSRQALNAIVEALSAAIYSHQLLTELESFLKKYEPEELAQKKAMEQAELARRKEQEAAGKIKPTISPGGSYEPRVRYTEPTTTPSYQPFGGFGDRFPSFGTPEKPAAPVTKEEAKKEPGKKEAGKKPEEKPKKEEEKKKADEKKKKEQKKKEKEAATKAAEKSVTELMGDLEKDLQKFVEISNKKGTPAFFKMLPGYMHDADKKPKRPTIAQAPVTEEQPEITEEAEEELPTESAEETGETPETGTSEETQEEAGVPEAGVETVGPVPEKTPKEKADEINKKLGDFAKDAKLEEIQKEMATLKNKIENVVEDEQKEKYQKQWKPLYNTFKPALLALKEVVKKSTEDDKAKRPPLTISSFKKKEHIGSKWTGGERPLLLIKESINATVDNFEEINKLLKTEAKPVTATK